MINIWCYVDALTSILFGGDRGLATPGGAQELFLAL